MASMGLGFVAWGRSLVASLAEGVGPTTTHQVGPRGVQDVIDVGVDELG